MEVSAADKRSLDTASNTDFFYNELTYSQRCSDFTGSHPSVRAFLMVFVVIYPVGESANEPAENPGRRRRARSHA